MEKFMSCKVDDFKMKNICGGKKITRKESGTMRKADGTLISGWYFSQYDTETRTYTYYSLLGDRVYCP